MTIRLLALGDSAWTVEFGVSISTELNAQVMAFAQRIAQARIHEPLFAAITDVVPTFRSLTVHFAPQTTDADALATALSALAQHSPRHTIVGKYWHLPACFDPNFAPDLSAWAKAKNLSEDQLIQRVLSTQFRVYMIGFLPGFPYMGGLPPELSMPRLASPRQRVPANSIAIAGEMCAVYPWESPGGWNLIGKTPVQLFDPRKIDQPAMLSAGDMVTWYPIDTMAYEHLRELCGNGDLSREAFLYTEAPK
ncbi:5-oxoprolinase subunit PxpB [Limnohabitans sp.]|uniref:5-oxoprolinase subunit PxpB n=1 Tax=Limnohabitans sp. TaxID=1907725 RepID=UPI00286FA3AB|nr:5-oxoprolinase subunit PxpB [Limnohabitans sp.]